MPTAWNDEVSTGRPAAYLERGMHIPACCDGFVKFLVEVPVGTVV
jgi:hypothetical protein